MSSNVYRIMDSHSFWYSKKRHLGVYIVHILSDHIIQVCLFEDITVENLVRNFLREIPNIGPCHFNDRFSSIECANFRQCLLTYSDNNFNPVSIFDYYQRKNLGLLIDYQRYLITSGIPKDEWKFEEHMVNYIETIFDDNVENFFDDKLEILETFDPELNI
jgi:hypothetical protein